MYFDATGSTLENMGKGENMSEQPLRNVGPEVSPDAIADLLASGVKVSHGKLYVEWEPAA